MLEILKDYFAVCGVLVNLAALFLIVAYALSSEDDDNIYRGRGPW